MPSAVLWAPCIQAAAGLAITITELDDLLPDRWLAANPAHTWTIDAVRREELKRREN